MKIYKLDIDTSKPIRKVVQMQQNSTGALSVDVSNDGKYIRNLSCALYEGDTELSAYATTDVGAGYKIDIGDETKVVKITARSVPYESIIQGVASQSGSGTRQVELARCQIKQGVYNQDEFLPLLKYGGGYGGYVTFWNVATDSIANANFKTIAFTPWNPAQKIWFYDADGSALPYDEPIVATDEVSCITRVYVKRTYTLSSETYPSIGYWTDYSLETVIRPSENAHYYAEQEVTDPEPEPTPDPEEPVEPTEG